jgi:DtxR family Mn-dependent transcriptional regulator
MTGMIALLVLLSLIVLFPRYGAWAQLRRWRFLRQREQVEDALKHLLSREQEGRHASLESLAGCLGLSTARTLRLIEEMQKQNLVEWQGRRLHLTPQGERWALHVVRAHRLWERYLADEARMPLEKIHAEAHRREHGLSEAELDALEAALGHPSHDPHGDPIPDEDAAAGQPEGIELTRWDLDRPARIVHLEDEPELALAQILASGLRLGQIVRVIERTPQRIVLSDGENEYRLAPAVAANIYVVEAHRVEKTPGAIPLSRLPQGQEAEVVEIDPSVQGFTRRRFLDLGLTPGARVVPELSNFFGDPRAYRLRGTLIALRQDQAEKIWVRRSQNNPTEAL